MRKLIFLFILLTISSSCFAETLFTEDFENGLGKWDDTHRGLNAQIVTDPLNPNNNVLTFTDTVSGGDLVSIESFVGQTGNDFILTFDYLGNCGTDDCGGFVGISPNIDPTGTHTWIGGTSAPYPDIIPDTGTWQRVSIPFTSSYDPWHIMLEDWRGPSPYNGLPGDAFFDNFRVTDANGPSPTAVPFPLSTWVIMIALLGLFGRKLETVKK